MLRFVIGLREERETAFIRYALFELGVRLNLRFTVQKIAEPASLDDLIVVYGDDPGPISKGNRLIRLFRHPGREKCAPVVANGLCCYGPELNGMLDVVAGTAALLSLKCEVDIDRDSMGRIAPDSHPLREHFVQPLLENNAQYLKIQIERASGELKSESRPFGYQGACVLTHDVDGPQLHTSFALLRSFLLSLRGRKNEWESFQLGIKTLLAHQPDPYWNFERWADLEKSIGANSTFYVYPGPTPSARRNLRDPHYRPDRHPFPTTLRNLIGRGCEIGVHHGIDGHGFAAYAESRCALEAITGKAPTGCRTHYWAGVWKDAYEAWKAMDRAGFLYDASLSPLTLGYRMGNMLPLIPSVLWRTHAADGFVVLPTSVMDSYANPLLSHLSGEQIMNAFEQIAENTLRGGVLVSDWHVRTMVNAGAHKGQLDAFMSTVWRLATNPGVEFLTAHQASERWRAHCARCWVHDA